MSDLVLAMDESSVSGATCELLHKDVERAINLAVGRYFDECRAEVPGFVKRHFHYPGAADLNRAALGWDMLRAPLNLFWAPLYGVMSLFKFALMKLGCCHRVCRMLNKMPAGFTTRVQAQISELIQRELLNLSDENNVLESYILDALREVFRQHNQTPIADQQFCRQIEPLLADALQQYQYTRTASADITNSLSCTVLGAFAFQKFTPGAIGVAAMLASLAAQELASRQFWLGETLGRWYFTWFPPEPSLALNLAIFAGVLGLLASFAALSGLITDPIQAGLGLHRRRLLKMLDHLQQDFNLNSAGSFRPKDHLIARILDGFDMLRSGVL